MMNPKQPGYERGQLAEVSEIELAVTVKVWHSDKGAYKPEWSDLIRERLTDTLAENFARDAVLIRRSEARPPLPWGPGRYASIEPLKIPDCESPGEPALSRTRLEVVAAQTVKTAGERARSLAGLMDPALWVFLPIMPDTVLNYVFGSGETVIRFCLYQPGRPAAVWAYGEWDSAGVDLREPANLKAIVARTLQHYRAAVDVR
jgi:hypothetical protein